MGINVLGRRRLGKCHRNIGLSLAGLVLFNHASVAFAQTASGGTIPWKFEPALTLTETYSDNINLSPAGQERSDWVTTISPSLVLRRKSAHLDLSFLYAPELLYYANGTNGTTVRNTLKAIAKSELVNDHLFFDADAQISQQNGSPFQTQAANTVNGSSNRAETRTLNLNPYFRSHFGSDGNYLLGYRYSRNDSDSNFLTLSNSNDYYASVSDSLGSKFRWSLNYDKQTSNYKNLNDQSTEHESVTLTYLFDSRLTLFVTGGQERNDYVTFSGESSDGSYYTAGFQWAPNPTNSLNAQHGHHYFGRTDHIDFTHRTPLTIWRAGYSNDMTSSAQQLSLPANFSTAALLDSLFVSRYPDPVARNQAISTLLQQSIQPNGQLQQFNFLTNQIYLQKRLDLSLALVGLRNTITFTFNRSQQKALSKEVIPLDIFAGSRSFRTTSFMTSWAYQMGPRTTASLSAQRTRSQALDNADESRQRIFAFVLQRQIQRNLSTSLQLRNTRQDGNFLGSGYTENAIIGSLHMQF